MPAKTVSPGGSARARAMAAFLMLVGNVEIDAAVLMLAVLGLEIGDKLAERLAFLGHHVGEQQAVEQAVALGQVALEADAAGLFAAHHDLALEHVGRQTNLKPMPCSMSSRPYFFAMRSSILVVLKARVTAPGQPLRLSTQLEQDGVDFVRVDEVAVLVGGADAVGVAVGAEAGVAVVGDGGFAEGADVRLDGLGIDAGKERIGIGADVRRWRRRCE